MGSSTAGAPAPPDFGSISKEIRNQSLDESNFGRDALQWAKDQFGFQGPYTQKFQGNAADASGTAYGRGNDTYARWQQVYQPVEDKAVNDAMTWDSEGNLKRNRARVAATVGSAFDAADANATRQLEAFGVDPTVGRAQALNVGAKLQRAAATAAAQDQSDVTTKGQAVQMRSDVANRGLAYPGISQGFTSQGTTTGAAGVSAGNQTASTFMPALGDPAKWFSMSDAGKRDYVGAISGGYNAQLGQYKANQEAGNQSSGIGSILGLGASLVGSYFGGPLGGAAAGGAVKTAFKAEGGRAAGPLRSAVPAGAVPKSASVAPGQPGDTVPAMLEPDEFVIPKRAVMWYGMEKLHKLIDKADQDMAERSPPPDVRPVPASVMKRPTFVSSGAASRGAVPMRLAA